MAENNPADAVLTILKNIQEEQAAMRQDIDEIKSFKDILIRIEGRIATMDSFMAGYHRSDNMQNDAIDELRGRIEGLEAQAKDDTPNP